jgi:hypothetical protein
MYGMSERLQSLVANRPIDEKPSDEITCPFCEEHVAPHEHMHTLVGQTGEITEDNDVNHNWQSCSCSKCHQPFTREYKHGNVWYTQDSELIKGVPNCFEQYIYKCASCGGKVRRSHSGLNGEEIRVLRTRIEGNKSIREYRTFYSCDSCDSVVEVDE